MINIIRITEKYMGKPQGARGGRILEIVAPCICTILNWLDNFVLQLRSSFSKAFSSKNKKNKQGSASDVEPETQSLRSDLSVPNSPLLQGAHTVPATPTQAMRHFPSYQSHQ